VFNWEKLNSAHSLLEKLTWLAKTLYFSHNDSSFETFLCATVAWYNAGLYGIAWFN